MNSKYSKPSKRHLLILNFTDKLDSRRSENSIALSNLSIYYTKNIKKKTIRKTLKAHTITINLKYQCQHGMIKLNYLMDHFLYWIFKISLSIFSKSMEKTLIIHQ